MQTTSNDISQTATTTVSGPGTAVRWACAVVLLLAAASIGGLLAPLVTATPEVIVASPGEATVRFEVDRPVTGRDGCFTASWAVEGVREVGFSWFFESAEGVIGTDSRTLCAAQDAFVTLVVTLLDDTSHIYQINVVQSTAQLAPLYIGLIALLAGAAVALVVAPSWATRIWGGAIGGTRSVRAEPLVVIGLLVLTTVIYLPTDFIVRGGDYEVHVYYTQDLAEGEPITSPHFINQVMTLAVASALPGVVTDSDTLFTAQYILNTIFAALTALTAYGFLRYLAGRPDTMWDAFRLALLTLGVVIAAPLFFPTLAEGALFMGYLPSSNMFHNPTYTLVRPMGFALAWIVLRLLRGEAQRSTLVSVAGAGLVVLSLLTKPTHGVVFLPALLLAFLWVLASARRLHFGLMLMGAVAVPVLAVQYGTFFTDADTQAFTEPSRVIFAPLAAMQTREPSEVWMIAKLLLSSAFPLALLAAYPRAVRQHAGLAFAWAMFAVSLVMAYTLAEEGKVQHANFIFSAQHALDLLMIVGVGWLAARDWSNDRARFALVSSALLLHIVAGAIWHGINVASGFGFAWWG
ncbi:MAG: hypothetical protein AAF125_04040 [Chloroflexota bacterium]